MISPFISVLMTAYNRQQYIAEAIESVLLSTYRNFELIIVDDCSNDRTVEIARKYKQQDNRVRVYVNEKNLGDYSNRNLAASYARCEYLMFVDSDDKITKDGIEKCVAIMENNIDCEFGINFKESIKCSQRLTPEVALRKHFFEKPFLTIGPGGTILKREFFLNIGKYPEKYGPANDMYFNLKAACNTNTVLLPFEFIDYRIHDGQQINNSYSYLYNNYRFLRDALVELKLPLDKKQKRWIGLKNKRRFTVNICKYFLRTFDFRKTLNAVHLAGFSFKDAMQGIFH